MNILDELRQDHVHLRGEMADLEAGKADRARLARFVRDLVRHAHAEDALLFHELEHDLPAGHGPLAVMREEHAEIEGLLARLDGADPAETWVREALRQLGATARDHFLKEEEVLFAFADRLVDAARLVELGAALRAPVATEKAAQPAGARIDPETTVAVLARDFPATIRVFQRHGLDFCCGGKRALGEACAAQGIPYRQFADELAAALAGGQGADEASWSERSNAELVGHLLARYHAGLRDELARLEAMAERARERHGAERPELVEVAAVTGALRRAMVEHLGFEEREIFPALLAERFGDVAEKLRAAEDEHEEVGALLARLRAASGGFAPPDWACNTWRGLYAGLAELERETHLHVHLENNVLFPRASEAALAAR